MDSRGKGRRGRGRGGANTASTPAARPPVPPPSAQVSGQKRKPAAGAGGRGASTGSAQAVKRSRSDRDAVDDSTAAHGGPTSSAAGSAPVVVPSATAAPAVASAGKNKQAGKGSAPPAAGSSAAAAAASEVVTADVTPASALTPAAATSALPLAGDAGGPAPQAKANARRRGAASVSPARAAAGGEAKVVRAPSIAHSARTVDSEVRPHGTKIERSDTLDVIAAAPETDGASEQLGTRPPSPSHAADGLSDAGAGSRPAAVGESAEAPSLSHLGPAETAGTSERGGDAAPSQQEPLTAEAIQLEPASRAGCPKYEAGTADATARAMAPAVPSQTATVSVAAVDNVTGEPTTVSAVSNESPEVAGLATSPLPASAVHGPVANNAAPSALAPLGIATLHSLITAALRAQESGRPADVTAVQARLKAALAGVPPPEALGSSASAPSLAQPAAGGQSSSSDVPLTTSASTGRSNAAASSKGTWGATFGIPLSGPGRGSTVGELPVSSPLNPWFLSSGMPSFQRTSAVQAPLAAGAAAGGASGSSANGSVGVAGSDAALLRSLPANSRGEPVAVLLQSLLKAEKGEVADLSAVMLQALRR